jgi:hypothetical protein
MNRLQATGNILQYLMDSQTIFGPEYAHTHTQNTKHIYRSECSVLHTVDLYPSPATGVKRSGGWLKERGVHLSQPSGPISAKKKYITKHRKPPNPNLYPNRTGRLTRPPKLGRTNVMANSTPTMLFAQNRRLDQKSPIRRDHRSTRSFYRGSYSRQSLESPHPPEVA